MNNENCCNEEMCEVDLKANKWEGHKPRMIGLGGNPTLGWGSYPDGVKQYGDKFYPTAASIRAARNESSDGEFVPSGWNKLVEDAAYANEASNVRKKVVKRGPVGKDEVDWHAKYIASQRELAEESARWGNRLKGLEEAYAEKLARLDDEWQKRMDEGFEEAYEMLLEERQRYDKLLEQQMKVSQENMEAAEKVATEGYSQAYDIIAGLQKKQEELTKELKAQEDYYEDKLRSHNEVAMEKDEYDGIK